MVDIHSHILYGIKDSPKDITGSLQIAKLYEQRGFSSVVSTPHFDPGEDDFNDFISLCKERYAELKVRLKEENIHLSVIPGAEVMVSPGLLELKDAQRLCFAGTSYMLIELPSDSFPQYTRSVLFWLGLQNIKPILAHPERNTEMWMTANRYQELIDTEILIQLDALSFVGEKPSRRAAHSFFRDGAVTFIATDAHQPADFDCFDKAIAVVEKKYGPEALQRIWNNSLKVLTDSEDFDKVGYPLE